MAPAASRRATPVAIVSGQVQISRTRANGDEVTHAVLTEGDCFAELALLEEGAVRSADATALAPTSCLTLDRGALNTFLDGDPEMLRRIPAALIAYIRRKDEAFADVALLDVPGRVARTAP